MPIPSDHRCNARLLKRNGHCQRPAGWGTPHPGAGRCKLHGGCAHAANITHGRYCKGPFPRIADLQQQISEAEAQLEKIAGSRQEVFKAWQEKKPAEMVISGLIGDYSYYELKDGK